MTDKIPMIGALDGLWLVAALAVLVFGLPGFLQSVPHATDTSDGIGYQGYVCVYKNGELVACNHNLLTDTGKNLIESALQNNDVNVTKLALANNTAGLSATDTSLQGEWSTCGLAAAFGSITDNGDGNWTISHTWTSTCDDVTVNAAGIYDGVGGSLFAEASFTSTTLQTNDQITVQYTITVS